MKRREFLKLSLGTAAVAALPLRARAESGVKEIRIGYQKNGVLVIARQQATMEKHFKPLGIDVKWVEFSSGPPMMEAMNVGSVDYGAVGDSPPVFAQAAGAAIVYAAGQPITNGQGILVPPNSPIKIDCGSEGQARRLHQRVERAQCRRADAGKGRTDLCRHHAGLSDAAGCGSCLRQWQHRCVGDLGSLFRDRRDQAEWPHSRQCVRDHQDQFVLSSPTAISPRTTDRVAAADHRRQRHRRRNGRSSIATRWRNRCSAVTGVPLDIQTVAAKRSSFAVGPITEDIIADPARRRRSLLQARLDSEGRSSIRDIVWRNTQT